MFVYLIKKDVFPISETKSTPLVAPISTDAVLGTTRSADNGSFSFSGIAPNTQVRLRVRARVWR